MRKAWDEKDSQNFIKLGHCLVPQRELQIDIIAGLLGAASSPLRILELCCGDGSLAAALFERLPECTIVALDNSPTMLERATGRLARHGKRFTTVQSDLKEKGWRKEYSGIGAVVSSLAIHHLNAEEKRELFRDVYSMLASTGLFIVADIVQPATKAAAEIAAHQWDGAVRRRSYDLAGDPGAYDFFREAHWNAFVYPDASDKPSPLFDQLKWLEEAGFSSVDVHWMHAGHAVFSGARVKLTK